MNIKPSRKGTFTKAAKEHGKSVQSFAAQVLGHKGNYSPAMVKKANFARNAAHFTHADSGLQLQGPGDPQPPQIQTPEWALQAGLDTRLTRSIQPQDLPHPQAQPLQNIPTDSPWKQYNDNYQPKAPTNWAGIFNTVLAGVDSFIPQPKDTPKINRPLSYNAQPNGTGSQALYADGGTVDPEPKQQRTNYFQTDKRKYVDSVLGAHKDLNWVQRLYQQNTPTLQVPGEPYPSTHLMGDNGQGYVFPTVVQLPGGQLQHLNEDQAIQYAQKTKTGVQLPPAQGSWFANNGYKQGTGVLHKFDDGGTVNGGGDPSPQVKKYGSYVSGREAWLQWANKPLLGGTAKDLATRAAQAEKISPALLYSSAMEEGMNQRIRNPQNASEAYSNANKKGALKDYAVDGFYNYGLDTFGDNYNNLVKGGYLGQDFSQNFKPYKAQNEKNQTVTTAAFKDDASALQAKAAMMAYSRDSFSGYAKKKNVSLSPEAENFFTLAAYNGGEGNAEKMLDYYNKQGLLKDNAFLTQKPKLYAGIYDNVMHRMQGANMLQGEKVFELGGQLPGVMGSMAGYTTAPSRYKKGKKMENGGDLPVYYETGTSHDLDEGTIKSLLDQGYELSF